MRIGLTGSHGVGKTTIINDLLENKEFKDFIFIPELARKNMAFFGKTPQDMDLIERHIFEPFVLLDQITYEIANDKFIVDRTVIDLLAYAKFLVDDKIYEKLLDVVKKYLSKQRYDFIFYIPIEFPLLLDSVRFPNDEFQKTIDNELIHLYLTLGIDVIKIKGNKDERLSKIYNHLKTKKDLN